MQPAYYINPNTQEKLSLRRGTFDPTAKPVYLDRPSDIDTTLYAVSVTGFEPFRDGFKEIVKVIDRKDIATELTRRAQARCKKMLLECDWTIGNDSPLTAENQQEWKAYRTFLRNINHQEGFPKVIDWGTPPEQVKEGGSDA